VWVADLTEHRTSEGKVYLCAIKDLFSNRIVGWAIDTRMKARLVAAAIEMAVARRDGDVAGCRLRLAAARPQALPPPVPVPARPGRLSHAGSARLLGLTLPRRVQR
jgi:transposase InsO family protein